MFQKYADGTRVAGEVDILSVDADGNFRIYDVKTSRYSFYDFTDKYGNKANYFLNPSPTQRMSTKDYYTLQLSAYKNLFESQYHTPITTLAILPFVLNYNKDVVDGVTKEKGIMITYNQAVNVPLVNTVKTSESAPTNSSIPIFNSALEIQDPINRILPENDFAENSIIGYYDKDGKLYKGYLKHIGVVEGVNIYLTKERDRGFGREGELNESSSYYVVLPNGKLIDTKTLSKSDDEAASAIMKALQAKPQKVKDFASEKTLIFDPASAPKVEAPKVETPATILSTPTESGAAKTAQAEQAVNNKKASRVRHTLLRRADDETRSTWNQEKELAWIKKVLPQLSENDRVKVVEGLIKVANSGAYAWGQFSDGIITLSDVAAEGTAYHEAFHVVFNLLLDQNERISLLNEYREKHPDMDNLSLEEELAEDFREFVMQGGKDTRSLGRKIIDFFKSLFIKTKYWKDFRPSSIYYFRAINEGKYAGRDNTDSFDIDRPDVRYRKIPSIAQLRAQEKSAYDRFNNDIEEYYREARDIIKEVNYRRFNTEKEAMRAFNESGIRKDFFYRITREGANNAAGYKIQLLTRDMIEQYKQDNNPYSAEYEDYTTPTENFYFDSLDPEVQMILFDKGWTKEQFDSISQQERDQAVKCIAL